MRYENKKKKTKKRERVDGLKGWGGGWGACMRACVCSVCVFVL